MLRLCHDGCHDGCEDDDDNGNNDEVGDDIIVGDDDDNNDVDYTIVSREARPELEGVQTETFSMLQSLLTAGLE